MASTIASIQLPVSAGRVWVQLFNGIYTAGLQALKENLLRVPPLGID